MALTVSFEVNGMPKKTVGAAPGLPGVELPPVVALNLRAGGDGNSMSFTAILTPERAAELLRDLTNAIAATEVR